MRKALKNSKLSSPSKFVRKVLSRTSNASKQSDKTDKSEEMMVKEVLPLNVELEIAALKEQVNMLQLTISELHQESDMKEKALANIVREKERLTSDLKKQKRCNVNLKQQLADEREFYYKEKQQYCLEMNDVKKLKTNLKNSDQALLEQEICNHIKETKRLKEALNQTLEANYNLSVKFLRMKNTKTDLKSKLKNLQEEHERAMASFKVEIDFIKSEIHDIIENKYKLPISPSSRKYLKIVKHNGNLIHENLCLQLQVDELNEKIHKLQAKQNRAEAKEKLCYINKKTRSSPREKASIKTVEANRNSNDATTVKIFEKNAKPDVPTITEAAISVTNDKEQHKIKRTFSKLTLCQVSENPSCISTETCDYTSQATSLKAVRTQSAPEIVQSSLFINDKSICSSVNKNLINN